MRRYGTISLVILLLFGVVGPAVGQRPDDPHGRAYERGLSIHLTREQAAAIAREHLEALGRSGFKIGRITESDPYFVVEVVTPEGSVVETLLVDKRTGWVRSEP